MKAMTRSAILIVFFLTMSISAAQAVGRDDEPVYADPEEQARIAHEKAGSDFIYEGQNTRALYFQNQQIIELLKEIRDEIQNISARQAKEQQQV